MLEVKVPGERITGYNGMDAATTVAKGVFMYNAGAFAAAHLPLGTPGYASTGDSPRMLKANGMTHSGFGVFPVSKLILQTQGSDQSLDTIASGARLTFYIGGEFETDEYDATVSGVGAAPGDKLWLNSSGQISLSTGTGAAPAGWGLPAIGELVQVSNFPSTYNWQNYGLSGSSLGTVNSYKKVVWFRLYPDHAQPAIRRAA